MRARRSTRGTVSAVGDDEALLGAAFVLQWVNELAFLVRYQRDYLTQLDAAIGDADHGINLDRGLTATVAKLQGMAEEAPGGMRATVPLQARKGRASYLGPRSMGHQDPGATSTALLFLALERAALGADGPGGGRP